MVEPARIVRVHPDDTVGTAIAALEAGSQVAVAGGDVTMREDVPVGHKVALRAMAQGAQVIKYGQAIGTVTTPVAPGDWVHSHNLATALNDDSGIPVAYAGARALPGAAEGGWFDGYRRRDGRVGTRNELWVLNTVGCVNHAAQEIAAGAAERHGNSIDGAYAFVHPYGCSQLGDDLSMTQKMLAGLIRHPNAGGVIVIGLGCENNQLKALMAAAEGADMERVRFFNAQEVDDEVEAGLRLADELAALMREDVRTPCPVADLVIGVKCGGSDGFSGLTANPLVGRITDRVTDAGGRVILSEVPEMFGAEHHLLNRAISPPVFEQAVAMIDDFKRYFIDHGQPVYENPSPGNKAGGLTTLEEKSLGAVQKGGSATITGVLDYGAPVAQAGLSLLCSPGNDAVSSTAEVASGATLLLFTTGRGTPLGFPVPTIKIASNDDLARRKPQWIDFNAGPLLSDADPASVTDDLMAVIIDIASGRQRARNEVNGIREIAIWKQGVTL